MKNLKTYSPNILRVGIAAVIMWFGFQQLMHPTSWTGFLPDFAESIPMSKIYLIYLNGLFEVLASLLMILGLFTRTASLLMAIHLTAIIYTLGYGPIALRNLGLVIALFVVFLNGKDSWSISNK